jgi:hypothetical protein
MKEHLDREDSKLAMEAKSSTSTLKMISSVSALQPHQRIQILQKYDSKASLRSRTSTESEGSFSKGSRKRGSIFIV